jgi:3(or 17)beta-hydroxysteroid dehydrogenase
MMGRLQDKIILITGATGAIGTAIVAAIRREGGTPVSTAQMPSDRLDHELDVTREEDWQRVLAAVDATWGRLDGLVNSAGITALGNIEDTSLATWRQIMAVNLDGTFLGCKYSMALLKRRGGAIVNMSSILGQVSHQDQVAYSASKGGIGALTKSVALYGARLSPQVRCNSLHPAYVRGPMVNKVAVETGYPQGAQARLAREIPLGRLGEPEDVAGLCIYLLSDEARFVTGAEFNVDGGLTAR